MVIERPNITWNPAANENIWLNRSLPKTTIVCHTVGGYFNSLGTWFRNPSAQASTNFGVAMDGRADMYVDPWGPHAPFANGYIASPDAEFSAIYAKNGYQNPNFWCVTPDTRILLPDLSWKMAGELRVGDVVMGFDEETTGPKGSRRKLQMATVTGAGRDLATVVKLTLSDGTTLHSTLSHKWLVQGARGGGAHITWMTTEEMIKSLSKGNWRRKHKLVMPRFFDMHEPKDGYEAGYLSAAFDGEGCLNRHSASHLLNLTFAQRDNEMLARVYQYLSHQGYESSVYTRVRENGSGNPTAISNVVLRGGRGAIQQFLAEMNPVRLLSKWVDHVESGTLALQKLTAVEVESAEVVGTRQIVTLGTSTKTYIAEGFGSHNTVSIEHEDMLQRVQIVDYPSMFEASTWIAAYLCQEFKLDPGEPGTFLGHYQIDGVNRPYCPGWTASTWDSYVNEVIHKLNAAGGTPPPPLLTFEQKVDILWGLMGANGLNTNFIPGRPVGEVDPMKWLYGDDALLAMANNGSSFIQALVQLQEVLRRKGDL